MTGDKKTAAHSAVEDWFKGHGFPTVDLEALDQVLVVRLPKDQQGRLLSDVSLREALIRQAQEIGFTRIALDFGFVP